MLLLLPLGNVYDDDGGDDGDDDGDDDVEIQHDYHNESENVLSAKQLAISMLTNHLGYEDEDRYSQCR